MPIDTIDFFRIITFKFGGFLHFKNILNIKKKFLQALVNEKINYLLSVLWAIPSKWVGHFLKQFKLNVVSSWKLKTLKST